VIVSLGGRGQRWIESSVTLKNLDPSLLMWNMCCGNIRPMTIPDRKCTVQSSIPTFPPNG
jgi:hypothetical protein